MGSEIDWAELERRIRAARGKAYTPYSRAITIVTESKEPIAACGASWQILTEFQRSRPVCAVRGDGIRKIGPLHTDSFAIHRL